MRKRNAALLGMTLSNRVHPEAQHAERLVSNLNMLLTALARQGIAFDIEVDQIERGGALHPGVVINFPPLMGTGAGGFLRKFPESRPVLNR